MIEAARTTSDTMNQVDVKMWKTWSRSRALTSPTPRSAS
jgi:hypothetical protein